MFKKFFPKSPDPVINTGAENSPARLGHLNQLIDYINDVPPGSGLQSVQAGTGIFIDDSDPLNPIIDCDGLEDFVPLAGTTKGGITGNVIVKTDEGGRITIVYPNEDSIILGTQSSIYSAISFYAATVNETIKLYIRGGDIALLNEDTGEQVSGIISTINGLSETKVNLLTDFNTASQSAYGNSNTLYLGQNGKQYLDNGVNSHLGYTKLPSHYFIDSCSYTQSGTSAPTVVTTFETQVDDFGFAGVTKSITYVAVGQYRISYQGYSLMGFDPYIPADLNKVKVIMSPGKVPLTILSYDVNFTALDRISVDIFVRQSTTGNLVNNALTSSVIDIYFYR